MSTAGAAAEAQSGSGARSVLAVTIGTTMVVMPVFLLGGMAVLVREELGFDEARLGLSAATFFVTSSAFSVVGGRIADRIGARLALFIAVSASATTLLGMAAFARSWGALTAFLVLGGLANGLGQPATSLAIARGVAPARHGMAFGIKQSASPGAGLVAGMALPVVALTLGWRWAFACAALGALAVVALTPRLPPGRRGRARETRRGDAPMGPLVLLAVACALGSMGAAALGTFLVESSVAAGISLGWAGLLLSLGSVTSIAVRLVTGWLADRREGRHLVVTSAMLLVGSLGFVLLAAAPAHPAFAVTGTLLAFGLGWGWHGLFFLAVVRLNPRAPGLASGVAQTGGSAGGVLAPALFGVLVTGSSYTVAWICIAVATATAAGIMIVSRRMLLRVREPGASEPAGAAS